MTPPTNNSELREILEMMFGKVSLLVLGQQTTITDPRNGGVGKMINFYAAEQAKKYEQYIRAWAKNQLPEKKESEKMHPSHFVHEIGCIPELERWAREDGYNTAIDDAERNFDNG